MKKILLFLILLPLLSCKKDLEEFKSIKNIQNKAEVVVPIFYSNDKINDYLNFIPNFTYSSEEIINFPPLNSITKTSVYTIDSIQLKTNIETDIPFTLDFQIYFLNSQNQIVDSLFNNYVQIKGSNQYITIYTDIDQNKYLLLEKTPKAILKYKIQFNNSNLKNEYYINSSMGVKVKFTYNIKL